MNIKNTLAVLGPAFVLALSAQLLKLTQLLPPYVLVFVIALLSSMTTILVRNFRWPAGASRANPPVRTSNKNSSKETGSVKWFNASKGFGFITRANGDEIFVHFRSIAGGRTLRDGQRVEFAVTTGSKGLQAEDVVALK